MNITSVIFYFFVNNKFIFNYLSQLKIKLFI